MSKKSFILYTDFKEVLDKLSDEQAGKVMKSLYQWQTDGRVEYCDTMTDLIITPLISQFKRDADKWESIRLKRSEAGKKGGRPRVHKAKQANASFDKQTITKKAVNANVTVNVNDTVTSKVSESDDSSCQLPLEDRPQPHRINAPKKAAKPVPYEKIFDLYAEKCPSLEEIRVVDVARKNGAKRLWGRAGGSKDPKLAMEYIGLFFDGAQDSAFLRGEKPTDEYPGRYGTFEVITRDGWITKIMEGKAQ